MDEFIPILQLQKLFKYWWVLVLAGLVGAGIGYAAQAFKSPIYEASASIEAGLDFTKIGVEPLTQYDEDIALANVEGAMRSPVTLKAVVQAAQAGQIQVTPETLLQNVIIERKHAFWELRYHDPNPQIAQTITELWAAQTYKTLLDWQKTGFLPVYVLFNSPTPAMPSQGPIAYDRNKMILAAAVIGCFAGILIVQLIKGPARSQTV
jgi:uncharacterized protein involved in exopolysaccharide biosynthesis